MTFGPRCIYKLIVFGPPFTVLPVFSSPVVTILHCDVECATAVRFDRRGGRMRCTAHAESVFPAGSPGDANSWLERACAAIRALGPNVRENTPTLLVLPPHVTLLKHLRVPRVDARKRARMVNFEAGQNIPCLLNEVVWDSVHSGEDKTTQSVMLAAAKLEIVEPLCAAAREAGFAPRLVIPAALAVLAASRATRPDSNVSELLLHIGSRAVTLLARCGRNFAVRTSALSGLEAWDDPEALGARLAGEATRSMLHFERQCGIAHPVRVWLTGVGTEQGTVEDALARHLKVPVQKLILCSGVEFTAPSKGTMAPSVLIEASGAALVQLDRASARLNLLPPALRTRQRRRGRQPWLIAAGVMALGAPIAPLIHYQRLAEHAEGKVAEMQIAIAPLRARAGRIRQHVERLEKLEHQIAAWRKVRETRTAWLEFLADLEQRVNRVEGVWFERMTLVPVVEGSPLKIAVSGHVLEQNSRDGSAAVHRVKTLTESLAESPFVLAVEAQRFDLSRSGLLGFHCVLVVAETKPL